MTMLGIPPNPVDQTDPEMVALLEEEAEIAEETTRRKSRPDVDAHLKAERDKLADEERKLATTKAAIVRTEQRLADLREDARMWAMFVEGRQKGIDTVERLKAKAEAGR